MSPGIRTVVLTLAFVAGASCSSGDDNAADRSNATSTTTANGSSAGTIQSTTTAPPVTEEEGVKAAYVRFWEVVDEYGKRTGRFDPVDAKAVLGAVATGGEYEHLFDVLQLNRIKGLVFRDGDTPDELAPVISLESPTRATVKDCRTDKGGVYNESTGERVDTPTEGRRLFDVVLVKEGSQWKVSSVGGRTNPEDPPCSV